MIRSPSITYTTLNRPTQTVIIAPMERIRRMRILGQGRHRSTDLTHPVLIF